MAKESAFGQGIRRVTSLLQALGHGPRSGMRLTDIATATKLSKPTAYRLLTGLNEVGLVEHDEATGHFHLGFEMFVLGSSAIGRYGISEIARHTWSDSRAVVTTRRISPSDQALIPCASTVTKAAIR
jgi:DNA-binding IclR family transcriptional regulator